MFVIHYDMLWFYMQENIKDTALRFLKYMKKKFDVSWKEISTLQAYQISLVRCKLHTYTTFHHLVPKCFFTALNESLIGLNEKYKKYDCRINFFGLIIILIVYATARSYMTHDVVH